MKRLFLLPLLLLGLCSCEDSMVYNNRLRCYSSDGKEYYRAEGVYVVVYKGTYEVYEKDQPGRTVVTGNCVLDTIR